MSKWQSQRECQNRERNHGVGFESVGEMVVPVLRWGRFLGGKQFDGQDQEFCYGYVNSEMSVRYPNGDVKQAVEHEFGAQWKYIISPLEISI